MPGKNKQLKVTLIKSVIAAQPKHKECIKGLGLRKLRHSVVLQDDPCIRGMINKVGHLLSVEEV
ncbi:MAG TPA: 50S ribosomal protein L30 [Gammaproteobacteria bacterium]|nr:50S ribosomal protein L30 [Gammaproteobacteria bacterium]